MSIVGVVEPSIVTLAVNPVPVPPEPVTSYVPTIPPVPPEIVDVKKSVTSPLPVCVKPYLIVLNGNNSVPGLESSPSLATY